MNALPSLLNNTENEDIACTYTNFEFLVAGFFTTMGVSKFFFRD